MKRINLSIKNYNDTKQKISKFKVISEIALDIMMTIIVIMFYNIIKPMSLLFWSISGTFLIISTLIFVASVYKYKKLEYNW